MSKASVRALRDALKQKSEALIAQSGSALEREVQSMAAAMRQKVHIKSGTLAETIEVEKTGDASFRIEAGGPKTTKALKRTATYERAVVIGSGDTEGIAKKAGGFGVEYDYARAQEFGTKDEPANPFFFNTYRAKRAGLKSRVKKAAVNSQA